MTVAPAHPATPPATAVPPVRHPDAPAPGSVLASHYSSCFGCGDRHPTGLHLTLSAGADVSVTAELAVTEEHQGAPGLAHGGLLACACDEALGNLAWLLQTPLVTGRLETDFLRPVPIGSRLFLTARCTATTGRRFYVQAQGRLDAADGPIAVHAAGILVQVGPEHFVRHASALDVNP